MTQEEKLTALKSMVGNSDPDEVLSIYLDFARSKILAKAYGRCGQAIPEVAEKSEKDT